ncbi:MAG: class II fructose-bisphosphate aldolase, partial [Bacilli bacterium]|nr:class II fructose-bisphosphate aldolase [Bacilli bacterium]
MLVNLNYVLKYAEEHKCAVGMFNATGFDSIQAIVNAAEELNVPVIIAHAEVHNVYNDISLVAPAMLAAAKNAKVPVCVHLDHGVTMEMIDRAIALGFTSIMVDASTKPYEENIKITKSVVEKCHAKNISVEAELGKMPTAEDGSKINSDNAADFYTDADEAVDFVSKTGIDALAISFGTSHGFYKSKPQLDFEVIKRCREKLNGFPLVMHGGSGVSAEDNKKVIEAGIRKINHYSYMSKAGYLEAKKLIESNQTLFFHDVAHAAMLGMKQNVKEA